MLCPEGERVDTGTARPAVERTDPVARVGARWIGALSLANLAVFMAFFTPIQILLPLQLEHLDAARKSADLAWVTGAGALVAVIANPLAGALSDRTAGRFGRRRPWIAGGAAAGAAGLVLTSAQHTLPGVLAGWCVAQAGL